MASRFRWASCYVNGRRVAQATDGTYSIKGNGEDIITEDGWDGHSDGAITTEMSLNRAIPVGGDNMSLEEALLNRQYVKVTWASLNGKVFQSEMRITDISFNGDHRAGTQTAALSATGGKPELIG